MHIYNFTQTKYINLSKQNLLQHYTEISNTKDSFKWQPLFYFNAIFQVFQTTINTGFITFLQGYHILRTVNFNNKYIIYLIKYVNGETPTTVQVISSTTSGIDPVIVIKTQISNLLRTTRSCDNLDQVRAISNYQKRLKQQ